ncbi:MAG TPA: class I SAM-dependent methyltransferase [Armatimonadota bacterium]
MDKIIQTNRARWDALAEANVMHSRPFFDFTREQAADYIYGYHVLPDVAGTRVLCLAGSGGQDAVAFGLLGAEVTVFDLSDVQLSRDREAALHHGLAVETIQGDMRDLSVFPDHRFDVVWQPYSINFCPTVEPVIREVARVLRPAGFYYLSFANPFAPAIDSGWDGNGYPVRGRYTDGEDITYYYSGWEIEQPDGSVVILDRPHEFRHTLSTLYNALAVNDFRFLRLFEWMRPDANPETGSWAHFTQCIPPYFMTFWQLVPDQ